MNETYDPENAILDDEEQVYEDQFDDFVPGKAEDRQSLMAVASQPPKIVSDKKQMVSIRLDPQDIQVIRQQAERAGIGYQTMISSLLHQYAIGDLVNIHEARKVLRA
jgi:predicted DNA binding CopG/RHH family protein